MSKEVFELSRRLNRFILAMQKAEHLWGEIHEQVGGFEISKDEIETAPIIVQKILTMFGKSKFSVMLPRFVDKARTSGGFGEMLCDLVELRKELGLKNEVEVEEDEDKEESIEEEEVVNG